MHHGLVAELVDALDSKSSSARSVGSSPTRATKIKSPFGDFYFGLVGRRTDRFGTPVGENKPTAKFEPYVVKGAHCDDASQWESDSPTNRPKIKSPKRGNFYFFPKIRSGSSKLHNPITKSTNAQIYTAIYHIDWNKSTTNKPRHF